MRLPFFGAAARSKGVISRYEKVEEVLHTLRSQDLYPDIRVIEGRSTSDVITINGKKRLLFCGYDYLGLSTDEEITGSIKKALDQYGTQSGGTPLISGTLDIHKKAEDSIAGLIGTETAMLFTSGALANVGVIPALMNLPKFSVEFYVKKLLFMKSDSYIFSDELNHATIVDGCRLSKSKVIVYKHKDIDDLREKLRQTKSEWSLIVTDGVFSMDGDIAPLPELVQTAKDFGAWLMVDDAHSVGVLGSRGEGTAAHFNLKPADITTGALGKAISILGGYAAVDQRLADYFRVTVRAGIFSGSLPPPLAGGLIKSVEIVKEASKLREKLYKNADSLRNGLKEMGFNTLFSESPTPIIPLLIGDDKKAIEVSRKLQDRGFYAPAVRWPAVPKKMARIRFTVQSNNTEDQIRSLLTELKSLDRELGFSR